MPGPTITVAGHSHRSAFTTGRTLLEPDLRERVHVYDFPGEKAGITPNHWAKLQHSDDYLALLWHGNQAAAEFTLLAEPITVLGTRPRTLPPRGVVAPFTQLMAYWRPTYDDMRTFLGSRADRARIFVLGTPPPKPDELIRSGLQHEPYFVSLLEQAGYTADTVPITDPETRVALWEALQQTLADTAAECGVAFMPVPTQTQAPDGTLLPELCSPDATHANPQYGCLYWEHLLAVVGTP